MCDVLIESMCMFSLRKVKLDQRKLTDNVNAVSDIARVCRQRDLVIYYA
jgi:hypothetical protein